MKIFVLVFSSLILASGGFPLAIKGEDALALPDKATLTRMYLQHYLAGKRINSTTVHAAMQMLADTGDWKIVLDELQSGTCRSEVHCIKVLGMMAEKEAQWRRIVELHERGEYRGPLQMGSKRPYVPTELVPALLRRATAADRSDWEHYVVALAQSRDERAKDFFLTILKDAPIDRKAEFASFHAAVGLANLHELAGIEWLIEHAGESKEMIHNAWPGNTPGRRMDAACDRALAYLSGHFGNGECTCSRGVEYWRKWWQDANQQVREDAYIPLVYWQQ